MKFFLGPNRLEIAHFPIKPHTLTVYMPLTHTSSSCTSGCPCLWQRELHILPTFLQAHLPAWHVPVQAHDTNPWPPAGERAAATLLIPTLGIFIHSLSTSPNPTSCADFPTRGHRLALPTALLNTPAKGGGTQREQRAGGSRGQEGTPALLATL